MRTLTIAVAVSIAGAAAAQEPARGWPREVPLEQGTLVVYSPQVEKLDGVTLSGRAAVSWEAKAKAGAPVFGVFWFDARVLVDKERRVVHVEDVAVTKVRFPNATPEQEKRVEEVLETEIPRWDLTPSLDELQAALAASERVKQTEQGIAATPPKIVVSNEPAVLLLYDGAPAVRQLPDSKLERVVNTPLFVVRDPSNDRFYLGSEKLWYEAADAKGPWKPVAQPTPAVKSFYDANPPPPPPPAEGEPAPATGQPPPGGAPQQQPGAPTSTAPRSPTQQPTGQQPTGQPPATQPPATQQPAAPQGGPQQPGAEQPASPQEPEKPPKIIVATEPTELIVFDGKPAWAPLDSAGKLLYAENTDGTVLVNVPTNETFVLVSGRWYKASSLAGPWSAVRPDRVPPAFKSIPPDSAVGEVRAFVAGTDEAEDALADTQIPQTTAVKRDQTLKVTYDGEPKFKAIEGTSMAYAVNTPFSVIKDAGKYWCCHQGVWYVADTPQGPWKVSDKRPPSVDQIPPSAPVYNVKYVHVYDTTPEVVYVGYLPGYTGVYPYYGVPVYGTGYYYPPYIGAAATCYPYPATFGVHMSWSPWGGFGVGFSFGTPFFSVGIHFGGYGRFYGPVGYRAPVAYRGGYGGYRAGAAAGYRAGAASGYRAGSVSGARAGAAAGAAAGAYTGARAGSAENLYNRPANAQRNAPQAQAAASRRSATASASPNNVYGDRSGNVYRQNSGGGWEKNTGSGWQSSGGGRSASAGSAPAGLGSDAAARSRASGASSFSGGGGRAAGAGRGGGFGGGGGRGGGRR